MVALVGTDKDTVESEFLMQQTKIVSIENPDIMSSAIRHASHDSDVAVGRPFVNRDSNYLAELAMTESPTTRLNARRVFVEWVAITIQRRFKKRGSPLHAASTM